ncbi:cytochrome c biogenesis CcdA family protein [Hoyosella sp. YIM 151337]|uniref:cytochrome c biogenesis CcdA family protein n=1 Tax=Hoyosella sp. YIM 151337 TaxID=2992742 RepID=UPI0022358698|nr:cytochrome c biogenesis CcdA family protein [Hoyosella sp. YIM 151337]MCW4355862.1 cytochrome c biogenesis CcdA family protein [Hoyosella sp. YIM 151337]
MDISALSFALAAGTVAAFNPCGFAMLPAYLTLVIAGETPSDHQPPVGETVKRAIGATAAMASGFILVFGAAGLVLTPIINQAGRVLPLVTVVIGLALVALGGWLLAGRELTVMLPKPGGGAPASRIGSMFGYGLAYATASLSCTIGPFLAVTAVSFRSGSFVDGFAAFLAYGAGMAVVVGVLALSIALAGNTLVSRIRRVLPYVSRAAGALMLLAGAYVAYYGVWELRLHYSDGRVIDPIVDTALRFQQTLALSVERLGVAGVLTTFAVVIGISWGGAYVRRRRAKQRQPS